ncbi:hypothetical protein [Galactobacter valiniphilus]|uniref:hypothetical protein n=1 Tax=Galactobacter valiniphilus TaxID=2676122 RepID=UPI003735E5A3
MAASLALAAFGVSSCAPSPHNTQTGPLTYGDPDGRTRSKFCQPLTPGGGNYGIAEPITNASSDPITIEGVTVEGAEGFTSEEAAAKALREGEDALYAWGPQSSRDTQETVRALSAPADVTIAPGQSGLVAFKVGVAGATNEASASQLVVTYRQGNKQYRTKGNVSFVFKRGGCG